MKAWERTEHTREVHEHPERPYCQARPGSPCRHCRPTRSVEDESSDGEYGRDALLEAEQQTQEHQADGDDRRPGFDEDLENRERADHHGDEGDGVESDLVQLAKELH